MRIASLLLCLGLLGCAKPASPKPPGKPTIDASGALVCNDPMGCKPEFTIDTAAWDMHCDLAFANNGNTEVCFDRTDGHGKKIPFTAEDQHVVTCMTNPQDVTCKNFGDKK